MTHSLTYRRILSRMGYYAYQNGLIYNHLNQEGGWDGHLACCRNFIMKTLEYYKPSRVTVLGSGWLLDLPLAEMLEKTEMIYLADIVHPPEVIRQAGELGRVVLVEQDITGGLIEEIWNAAGNFSFFRKLKSLGSISMPEFVPAFDPGVVISLNILTQLESRLVEWLKKRSDLGEEQLLSFRKSIQEKHIEFLLKNKSVLITDYEEVVTKKTGEVNNISTLLVTLPQSHLREEWTWDFDLTGHENYNSKSVIKVLAMTLG
jgi:hypothetical protein